MKHTPFEQIVDLAEDRLPPPAREQVQRHLDSGCPACRDTLRWVNWVRDRMQGDTMASVPEWLQSRLNMLFDDRRDLSPSPPQGRRIAALLHDSLTCDGPSGFRRAPLTGDRYLLFRAGSLHIDLQILTERDGQHPTPRHQIVGQVLGRGVSRSLSGLAVELLLDDRVVAAETTDAFGEFRLADVPGDRLALRITPPAAAEILLLGIDVTASRPGEPS